MIKKVRELTDEFAKKEGPSTKIPETAFKIMEILNESL